jgi:hypothetical protein
VFTAIEAVKAENAFAYSYIAGWLAAAFAIALTQFAVYTFTLLLADPPYSEPVEYSKQSPQRA